MKVIVTLEIEVKEKDWAEAYGITGKRAIAADVKRYAASGVEDQVRSAVTPHCWVEVRNP